MAVAAAVLIRPIQVPLDSPDSAGAAVARGARRGHLRPIHRCWRRRRLCRPLCRMVAVKGHALLRSATRVPRAGRAPGGVPSALPRHTRWTGPTLALLMDRVHAAHGCSTERGSPLLSPISDPGRGGRSTRDRGRPGRLDVPVRLAEAAPLSLRTAARWHGAARSEVAAAKSVAASE